MMILIFLMAVGLVGISPRHASAKDAQRPNFGRMLIYGDKMALHVDHPNSLRFFDIPPGHAVLCAEDESAFRDQRSRARDGGACLFAFCPSKDLSQLPHRDGYSSHVQLFSCKKPMRPDPTLVIPLTDWVDVKSPGYVNLEAPFFLATTEYRGSGEGGSVTPKAPFARVYGIDGKVLHDYKLKSEPPRSVVSGLSIDKAGAVIGLGEFVSFFNGCDGETSPKKMRQLFLWESSGETKVVESSVGSPEVEALMSRFGLHESLMPWFNWEKEKNAP